METLGSLIDKLIITKKRYEAIESDMTDSKQVDVTKLTNIVNKEQVFEQVKKLEKEISELVYTAYMDLLIYGTIDLKDPKYKIYKNENPSDKVYENIARSIDGLIEANLTLWDLEDSRRDKTKTDAELRVICDGVAKWNRVRNDAMDKINELFTSSLKGK